METFTNLPTTQRPQENAAPIGLARQLPEEKDPADDFTKMQVLESSIVHSNLVSQTTRRAGLHVTDLITNGFEEETDPEFSPYDEDYAEDIKGFPPEIFLGKKSLRQIEMAKKVHGDQTYNLAAMESMPILSTATSMAAGALDPTYMMPIAGWGARGISAYSRFVRSAGAAVAVESVGEVGFHLLQNTRTMEDSMMALGAAGILGGSIGAYVKNSMTPEEILQVEESIYKNLQEMNTAVKDPTAHASMYSTSHAYDVESIAENQEDLQYEITSYLMNETPELNMDDAIKTADAVIDDLVDEATGMRDVYPVMGPTTGDIAESNLSSILGPLRQALKDPIATDLADNAPKKLNPMMAFLAKATPIRLLGSNSAVARNLAVHLGEQNMVGSGFHAVETAVKKHENKAAKAITAVRAHFKLYKTSGGTKSSDDFGGEVLDQVRYGNSTDPNVVAAAKSMNSTIFKPMLKEAIDAGVFTAEEAAQRFGEGYVPRFFNKGALMSGQNEFQKDISDYIMSQGKASIEDARKTAAELFHTVNGGNSTFQKNGKMMVSGSKFGKARTLQIPDRILQPYLVNNLDFISTKYTRSLGGDIELNKRFGSSDLEVQFKELNDEYDELVAGKSSTEVKKINKERGRDIRDLEAIRDRLLGFYGVPPNPESFFHRAGSAIKHLNVVDMLGGMTISAIPDATRPVWVHGFGPWMKEFSDLMADPAAFKMTLDDIGEYSAAASVVLDHRARSFAGSDFNPHADSRIESAIEAVSMGTGPGGWPGFDQLSLMAPWNAVMKGFSAVLNANQLNKKLLSTKPRDLHDLHMLGINPDMAKRIHAQIEKHGVKHKSSTSANTTAWKDDPQAAVAYEMAIIKQTDTTIVTPGVLDKPLYMDTTHGSMFGQMQSFAYAAHNKMLLAGVSHFDIRIMMGLMASTALGMMSTELKRHIGNKADQRPEFSEWMLEGLLQSGALGLGGMLNDRLIEPAMDEKRGGEFVAGLMGPSVSTAEKVWNVGMGAKRLMEGRETTNEQDRAAKGLAPYNNLFYLNAFFSRVNMK